MHSNILSRFRLDRLIIDQLLMIEHLFSVFWFMLVLIQVDTHDQTLGKNSFVLKFLKFLMHLDNLGFKNNGQECQL